MQGTVTVVNPHPRHQNRDRHAGMLGLPGLQLAGMPPTSGNGTAKDPERTTHVRIPAGLCTQGYLPYAQWAALPAAEKRRHWTLKRGWKLVQGAVTTLTAEEYAHLEKNAPVLHRVGHLGQPGTAAAALACGRELRT